jgi:predicted nucleic acid-binding protein
VTESNALFDTWAWWEYLHGTATGASLRERFVTNRGVRIHTSAITFGELAARLSADGAVDRIASVCGAVRRMSHVWDVTADIAQDAGSARSKLRETDAAASLADGIILVTAQRAQARIVSADPAFASIPGVIRD